MKKILILFLTFLLFSSCGYKPIYSESENSNYKINIISTEGDKGINNLIVRNLNQKFNKSDGREITTKIKSNYSKRIVAKNAKGSVTDYELQINVNFEMVLKGTKKVFSIEERLNIKKLDDILKEKNYEKTVKKNLTSSIVDKLILRISTFEWS